MTVPKMPEGEVAIWGAPDTDERDQIVRRLFTADQMHSMYLQGRREALEEAAKAAATVLDMKEEARAEQASRDAAGTSDELARLRHYATVSTFNAGVRRCAAAIRELSKEKEQ